MKNLTKILDKIFLTKKQQEVKSFVLNCRENSKIIKEVKLNSDLYPNISSFNFTRMAFYSKEWNELSTKARGIFIDTKNWKIVARGFDKFFNIDETEETKFENIGNFFGGNDVDVEIKENGYLGIVSTIYNKKTKSYKLIFGQKSRLADFNDKNTKYACWFNTIFYRKFYSSEYEKIADYLGSNNLTALFEVIIPEKDSHIINYKNSTFCCLALVKNDLNYTEYPINEEWKKLIGYVATKINTVPGFVDLNIQTIINNKCSEFTYEDDNIFINKDYIEGIVLKDKNTFKRVKIKSSHYNYFKQLRGSISNLSKTLNESMFNSNAKYTFNVLVDKCKESYDEYIYNNLGDEYLNYKNCVISEFTNKIDIIFPEFIEINFMKFSSDYNYVNMQNYIYNVKLYFTYLISTFKSSNDYLYILGDEKNIFNDLLYFKKVFEESLYQFNTNDAFYTVKHIAGSPIFNYKYIDRNSIKDVLIVSLNKVLPKYNRTGIRPLELKKISLEEYKNNIYINNQVN